MALTYVYSIWMDEYHEVSITVCNPRYKKFFRKRCDTGAISVLHVRNTKKCTRAGFTKAEDVVMNMMHGMNKHKHQSPKQFGDVAMDKITNWINF